MMDKIDIHADDYCISSHASEDILECLRRGKLTSISVLPNMSCFEDYALRYRQEEKSLPILPLLSVHLNFMEGRCVAKPEEVRDLVDEKGYFNISWGSLFVWNYSPKKFLKIKKQLKAEIKAQTERFLDAFGRETELRFDSHQHTHMIPIVYWALLEVIVEQRYATEYIRVTREPALPYIRQLSLWKTYRPVNWIKNLLLNFYASGMEKTIRTGHPAWQRENEPMFLWGVVMSGHMDRERVEKLLPAMKRKAEKKGRRLEILFHPGTVLQDELGEEFSNKGANGFHISEDRHVEFECVMEVQGITEESWYPG